MTVNSSPARGCFLPITDCAREQKGANVLADHRDGLAHPFFGLGEEAAVDDRDIANLRQRIRCADDRGAFVHLVLALHVFGRLVVGAVENAVAGRLAEVGHILGSDALVAALLLDQLLAGQSSDGGDLRHQVAVAAERLGRDALGVGAQAVDGRAHQHHAGDADDDSQQREKAAQFMRADGVQRQGDGRRDVVVKMHGGLCL